MKTTVLLPTFLLAIISVLIGVLVYENVQWHRTWKGQEQFEISVFVQLYKNLDRGQLDEAKRRLGALVMYKSDYFEKQYGTDQGTKFTEVLAQAKDVRTAFKAMPPLK